MRANILDRVLGYVAPRTALRRVQSRQALETISRSYTGAQRDRKTMSWHRPATSADAELATAGALLRDSMRALERNNPHAANAISQLVAHVIGDGIVPRAKSGNKRRDKRVNDLWTRFADSCDADGLQDFYGLQALAFRQMIVSGDGLIRRKRMSTSDRLPIPLTLQVFETDLIDSHRVWPLREGDGYAVQGVQFNAASKRVAYWLFPTHPGNNWLEPHASLTSSPVPAGDVAHIYELQRTQVRGAPWGTPVIGKLHSLEQYEEAELVRKRIESCMVGILVGGEENEGIGIPLKDDQQPGIYDTDGYMMERFEPGMFAIARGGREVKFNTPAATGSYEAYKRVELHTIAAGFRMPYALLSGDLTQVNYSSSKVGLEAFKRLVSAVQWRIVIPMLCMPVWRWFCEAAYLAGAIDSPDIPVEWTPPRFMSADPKKDAEATVSEIRAGLKSPQRAIAETGYDPDDVLAEFQEWNAKLDAAGVALDSDPRRMTKVGQAQQAPPDPDENTPETTEEEEPGNAEG